jgi:hypothetical protein
MDVRRAAGIRHRLDRAEVVFAAGAGEESAVALEVAIATAGVAAAGVQVDAVSVGLPDLDDRVADRLAARVEDAAGQVRDLADRGGDMLVHNDQVVVGIERQMIGIEGPFGLPRRAEQLFGEGAASEQARRDERAGCQTKSGQETATRIIRGRQGHVHLVVPVLAAEPDTPRYSRTAMVNSSRILIIICCACLRRSPH